MGLDIKAYSKLQHLGDHPDAGEHHDGWCQDEEHIVQAFTDPDFSASFRGIPVLTDEFELGSRKVLWGGCYVETDATDTHFFEAGSYPGYGRWRADLRAQFNPSQNPDLPFYELIWFADDEGVIGPDAARDLLADFQQHFGRYVPGSDVYRGIEKYHDWTRACELAADGGLINFR